MVSTKEFAKEFVAGEGTGLAPRILFKKLGGAIGGTLFAGWVVGGLEFLQEVAEALARIATVGINTGEGILIALIGPARTSTVGAFARAELEILGMGFPAVFVAIGVVAVVVVVFAFYRRVFS